jgi:hypothetical protein
MTADRIWASRGYGLLARDAEGPWRSLGQVPQPAWRRVCAQSELVTLGLRLGVHGVVRLASGALLVCVSGGLLRGGEGGPWQSVMEFEDFRKPARQGLAQDRKGRIFLAQYARNHNRALTMHLWRSEDDGRSFQVLRRFEPGEVRHLHFVQEDPVDGSLWLGTGDRSDESSLRRSIDGGETWDVVGQGSQKWRAMSLAFLNDAIYYGTDAGSDSPEYKNQIVRLDRRTGEAVEVRAVQGPVHGVSATREGGVLIATAVEGGGNETDDSVHVWHSPDGDAWREVASWPAGSQPRRVQYGLAQFVAGQAEASNLCIVLRGVQGMPLGFLEARLR